MLLMGHDNSYETSYCKFAKTKLFDDAPTEKVEEEEQKPQLIQETTPDKVEDALPLVLQFEPERTKQLELRLELAKLGVFI